jgi:hypothetical protein
MVPEIETMQSRSGLDPLRVSRDSDSVNEEITKSERYSP